MNSEVNHILDGFKRLSEEFRKATESFNYNFNDGLSVLANHGWYINDDMTLFYAFEGMKFASKNEIEKLDNLFSEYYSSNSRDICNHQIGIYPQRKNIILEAYKAHEKKMYFASIALFLSQADGICKGELFKTRREKEAIKSYIKELYPLKVPAFLQVITSESAIDAYFPERNKFKSGLNRHGVFHGYDTEYGNRTNSLKAMSILAFITSFLERYVNIEK